MGSSLTFLGRSLSPIRWWTPPLPGRPSRSSDPATRSLYSSISLVKNGIRGFGPILLRFDLMLPWWPFIDRVFHYICYVPVFYCLQLVLNRERFSLKLKIVSILVKRNVPRISFPKREVKVYLNVKTFWRFNLEYSAKSSKNNCTQKA